MCEIWVLAPKLKDFCFLGEGRNTTEKLSPLKLCLKCALFIQNRITTRKKKPITLLINEMIAQDGHIGETL